MQVNTITIVVYVSLRSLTTIIVSGAMTILRSRPSQEAMNALPSFHLDERITVLTREGVKSGALEPQSLCSISMARQSAIQEIK
jgi:hypothetical protein